MKEIKIIALHLAYGGVEKAICNMANMFIEQYPVEIICVYKRRDKKFENPSYKEKSNN